MTCFNGVRRVPISDAGGFGLRQPDHKEEEPYWPDNPMKRYIKPVAKANSIYNIGWHTFRHTFGTLLKGSGKDVKTVQELLRHANSRIRFEV